MLALLRTRRWISFTLTGLAAVVAFAFLSHWQWTRAEEKKAEATMIHSAAARDPSPLAGATVADPQLWTPVTARGHYTGEQFLLRNRPMDRTNGFWVVSSFVPNESTGSRSTSPATVWVVRGWIPQREAANAVISAPPSPEGTRDLHGYVRAGSDEALRAGPGIPTGQISAMNVPGLNRAVGAHSTSMHWYVQASSDPELTALKLPVPDDSRNLSYAGQWLLFAAIAVGGWWYFLRREAAEQSGPGHSYDGSGGSVVSASSRVAADPAPIPPPGTAPARSDR